MSDTLTPLSPQQRSAAEDATRAYEEAMPIDVIDWLDNRGIGFSEISKYRLGYVDEPHPGHEGKRNKLAIPYLDRDSKALVIRFRCLDEVGDPNHSCKAAKHGKYVTVSGEHARTYNISAVHQADDEIHIAEGELDTIILNKVGLPAIGLPGATNWGSRHRRMLAGFSKIYVWGDPDEAGGQMVNAITQGMRQARGVRMRSGDVTDSFQQGGAEALRELIIEQKGRLAA